MSSRTFRKLHLDPCEDAADSGEDLNVITKGSLFSQFSDAFSLNSVVDTLPNEENLKSHGPCTPKKKKKNKKKLQPTKKCDDDSFLTSSTEYPAATEHCTPPSRLDELLKVTSRLLDYTSELSRMFGSDVVRDVKNNVRHKRMKIIPGLLIQIKPTWPPATRLGLDMERLDATTFTFVHSKEYQNIQMSFYAALDSLDPNNLTVILSNHPYHIDSLIQLSDIMMQQDNSNLAMDLLERALHAYQSSFHPSFTPLNGSCRLDYKRQVNRGLFVALFRYITMIGERGCNRSALEYCKLLLSLDSEEDPLMVLLMIDRYAIFSRQFDFLISLYEELNESRNLHLLPNFAFSVPLAYKLSAQENGKLATGASTDTKPDLALQDALIMFPGFLTRLLKHTSIGGITNLDKSILFGKEVAVSESESLGCLLNLYVARMYPIWSSRTILHWLEKNVETVLKLIEPQQTSKSAVPKNTDSRLQEYSEKRKSLYPPFPPKILRHLTLAEVPEAPPILPRNLRNTPIYNFDPLPPKNSINIYDPEEERRRIRSQRPSGSILNSLFASFLPSYSTERPMAEIGIQQRPDQNANGEGVSSVNRVRELLQSTTERFAITLQQVLDRLDTHIFEQQDQDTNVHDSSD